MAPGHASREVVVGELRPQVLTKSVQQIVFLTEMFKQESPRDSQFTSGWGEPSD